jgi:hypothetical protein
MNSYQRSGRQRAARKEKTVMTDAEKENAEKIAAITTAFAHAIEANDQDIIRQAGEDLNGLGGFGLMRRVLNEVAESYDSPEYERVCNMVDKTWDGIGDWLA